MKQIAVILICLIVFVSSCKREGCTDSKATNYCEDCKKDDGTYDCGAELTSYGIWFDKATSDSLIANNIDSISICYMGTGGHGYCTSIANCY